MLTSFLRTGLAVTLLLLAVAAMAKEPRVEGGRLAFGLPDLNGEAVASADTLFDGKVLLVEINYPPES